jgi:hypothetical protein
VTVAGSTQLTVPIPADYLANSYTASVLVSNPAPGGGSSNAVAVPINPATPASATLAPGNVSALSGGFELQVNATNVLYNSVVVWNCADPSCSNSDAILLNTHLTTPPTTTGGTGTLTAVVTNRMIASQGMVPVAVANQNADGSITNAISAATNFTVNSPGTPACLLAGAQAGAPGYRNYAFVATGADNNGAASMVGSFRIDNSGAMVNTPLPNIVNSFTDFKDAKNLFAVNNTGTLGRMAGGAGSCVDTMGVPGVGKLSFTVSGIAGDTFTLNYALRHNGFGGRITLTDSLYGLKATGQLQIQFSSNAFNQGSFAFGLLGENASAARYAVIGAMCTSSPVFLQADFDDTGTPSTATASAWSLNNGDATTGRTTTSQLNFSNGRFLNLTLYGVGGGKAYVIESSPVASSAQVLSGVMTGFKGPSCLATGKGGTFNNSSMVNSVFGASSQGGGNSFASLGIVNNIAPSPGGLCPAGQTSATLIADENFNGSGGMIPATAACYSVSSAGRAVLTFTDPLSGKGSGGTFYLDGGGNGYLLGGGGAIPYGFVQSQAAPPPLPAIGSDYSFAPLSFPGGLLNATSVAINAVTTTSGTLADISAGGSCNGAACAYALNNNIGRGTATLNSATTFGDSQVVFYELGGNQLYIMGQTTAVPMIGALFK